MIWFASRPWLLVVSVVMVFVLGACRSNPGDEGTTTGGVETPGSSSTLLPSDNETTASVSLAALASSAFVTAAIDDDDDAAAQIATQSFDDAALGAPFQPSRLTARLAELESFKGLIGSVKPSDTAYPLADDGLGPSCSRPTGLRCDVEIFDAEDRIMASVVVYWFDDGVSDFSIVTRDDAGRPIGIGRAHCGGGSVLVHGGHTPNRFDIAVCVDEAGALEYNGVDRSDDLGLRVEACQQDSDRWTAANNGFRYFVDGSISSARSTIQVIDPDGKLILGDSFTTVAFDHPTSAILC